MKGVLVSIEQRKKTDISRPEGKGREKAIIHLWVRGIDGKRYMLVDDTFDPYFFIKNGIPHPFKEIKKLEVLDFPGLTVDKLTLHWPGDVRKLRAIIEKRWGPSTFEADVLFVYRYLIDKKIRASIEWSSPTHFRGIDEELETKLRIFILDIENFTERIIRPGKFHKKEYILCCTIYDSYTEKYYTWYIRNRTVTPKMSDANWILIRCKDEVELLTKIFDFIVQKDPDVISGYNIDYDLLCLRSRAVRNGIADKLDAISPLGYIPRPRTKRMNIRGRRWQRSGLRIPGRVIIDIWDLVRQMTPYQLPEYSLEYVSKKMLKPPDEKLKWKGLPTAPQITKIWPIDPLHILNYNKKDVELCVKLDKQKRLISFVDEMRKVTGAKLGDVMSTQKMIDLESLRRKTRPMPTKRRQVAKFKGAYVFDPIPGIYKWVIQLDYSGLYPCIIRTFNIDPDTFVPAPMIKYHDCYTIEDPELDENGVHLIFAFKKKPKGLFPMMLEEWTDRRNKKKELQKNAKTKILEELYHTQQDTFKTLSNAVYGTFGYRSRKASFWCAQGVTTGGKIMLQFAAKIAEDLGYKAIYGDTDSIFVLGNANTLEEVKIEGKKLREAIVAKIPSKLKGMGYDKPTHLFNLEMARIYSSYLIVTKKRYAGNVVHGRGKGYKEVKGLASKRSDTSLFAKETQGRLLDMLLDREPKEKVLEFLDKKLNDFEKKPLWVIGVPSAISQLLKSYKVNSIQKKAAVNSNEFLGTNFNMGDKPKRIYIKLKNPPVDVVRKVDVVALEGTVQLKPWMEIDWRKMFQKTVKTKLKDLLAVAKIDWEEVNLPESLKKIKKVKKPKKKKKKKRKKKVKKGGTTLDKWTKTEPPKKKITQVEKVYPA